MIKLNTCFIFLLLALNTNIFSQTIEREIDAILNSEYPSNGTGAAALVAIDGKIIYQKAFGKSNLEHDVNTKNNTVFEIGSVTKQFTSVAILMLHEQGKLNINAPIEKYIDGYPTHGHTIRIHHLLSHTSGIASFTALDEWYNNRNKEISQEEFLTLFKKTPMLFSPESNYHYSNTGYFLLGMIIEKVSGKPYDEFINDNIFKKVGMKNSTFINKNKIINNIALGHSKDNGELEKSDQMLYSHAYSAGAILSTTYDLFLWNRAIKENTLITEISKTKAFTNYPLKNGKLANYGFGWAINEIQGTHTLEHNGGTFGSLSNTIYAPKKDVFVVVLSNCVCSNTIFAATKIMAVALEKPYKDPKSYDKTIRKKSVEKYLGRYTFDDGTIRTISFSNNTLYSQLLNRNKLKIHKVAKDVYQFENSFAQLIFRKDSAKHPIVVFKNRIQRSIGKK